MMWTLNSNVLAPTVHGCWSRPPLRCTASGNARSRTSPVTAGSSPRRCETWHPRSSDARPSKPGRSRTITDEGCCHPLERGGHIIDIPLHPSISCPHDRGHRHAGRNDALASPTGDAERGASPWCLCPPPCVGLCADHAGRLGLRYQRDSRLERHGGAGLRVARGAGGASPAGSSRRLDPHRGRIAAEPLIRRIGVCRPRLRQPPRPTAACSVAELLNLGWIPGLLLIPVGVLYFPDGLLPSPRWRVGARAYSVVGAAIVVTFYAV